jgi:hypothetical protein
VNDSTNSDVVNDSTNIDVVNDNSVLFNEIYYHTIHLTQQEDEVVQLSNWSDNQTREDGVIQGQPQKKYDLMMREGAPKATTFDKNKQVEVPPNKNPSKGMSSKTQPPPSSKHEAPEIKEVDRPLAFFILEHDFSKIKILIPLT